MSPDLRRRYLRRIGIDATDEADLAVDIATLTRLQQAHLSTVPFENLHVYRRNPVRTDLAWSLNKVVDQRRGGWCFELNGAFAALLTALGFEVLRLGAAVLLAGPTTIIDHLTLEVQLDEPWLVDVGFGESFTRPLPLNRSGPHDGGIGDFVFLPSPQGTTMARMVDGVPAAHYRFKRVAHELDDFTPASDRLQSDRSLHWSQKPFATRLIDGGPDRVTLLRDRLKTMRDGVETVKPIAPEDWDATLAEWFGL